MELFVNVLYGASDNEMEGIDFGFISMASMKEASFKAT